MEEISFEKGHGVFSVNPDSINVLTQVRKSIDADALEELMESIDAMGYLINPLSVAVIKEEEIDEYLSLFNEVHNSAHKKNSLVKVKTKEGERYLMLMAGHRRLMAIKKLNKKREDKIKPIAILHFNINPEQALKLQIVENTHQRVAPEEEALTLVRAYRLYEVKVRGTGGKPTLADFSRQIGRNTETIRRALYYVSLPKEILNIKIEGVEVPYGVFVEVGRLFKAYQDEKLKPDIRVLQDMIYYYFVRNMTVSDFRKFISERIEAIKNITHDLFSGLDESAINHRRVVASEATRGIYAFISYMSIVDGLHKAGVFSNANSEYSTSNIVDVLKRASEGMERSLGVLDSLGLIHPKKAKDAYRQVANTRSLIDKIT